MTTSTFYPQATMKLIVQRSAAVATFFGLLGLNLYAPQLQHLQRLADLLVVAPRRKTLAELAAQEFDGVDLDARFLRSRS